MSRTTALVALAMAFLGILLAPIAAIGAEEKAAAPKELAYPGIEVKETEELSFVEKKLAGIDYKAPMLVMTYIEGDLLAAKKKVQSGSSSELDDIRHLYYVAAGDSTFFVLRPQHLAESKKIVEAIEAHESDDLYIPNDNHRFGLLVTAAQMRQVVEDYKNIHRAIVAGFKPDNECKEPPVYAPPETNKISVGGKTWYSHAFSVCGVRDTCHYFLTQEEWEKYSKK